MSPSIDVGGTFEIPVFARIVKVTAAPSGTTPMASPPVLVSELELSAVSLLDVSPIVSVTVAAESVAVASDSVAVVGPTESGLSVPRPVELGSEVVLASESPHASVIEVENRAR